MQYAAIAKKYASDQQRETVFQRCLDACQLEEVCLACIGLQGQSVMSGWLLPWSSDLVDVVDRAGMPLTEMALRWAREREYGEDLPRGCTTHIGLAAASPVQFALRPSFIAFDFTVHLHV